MPHIPAWRKSSVGMLSRRTVLTVPIAAAEGALRSRGLRATETDEPLVAVSVKPEGSSNRVFERSGLRYRRHLRRRLARPAAVHPVARQSCRLSWRVSWRAFLWRLHRWPTGSVHP